jgi:hypothetical protein
MNRLDFITLLGGATIAPEVEGWHEDGHDDRLSIGNSDMRSLQSVTFDATNLVLKGDDGNKRAWLTTDGDPVTLYYFTTPSFMSASPQNLDRWRAHMRESTAERNGAIVEVEPRTINGCAAIHDITKIPQTPFGMGYLGCVTLPFRDFGYMVAVACPERGITGMRDTAIFSELIQKGEVTLVEEGNPIGWMEDPYDPSVETPPGRNRSDDAKYDARFPDHPLSRVRHLLRQIESTLRLSGEVKGKATDW